MVCLTILYRETKWGPVSCLLKSTSMFCRSCTSIPLPRSGFPHVHSKRVPVTLDCMQLLMEPFSWIFFLSHLSLDGRRYTSEKDEQYYKLNLEDFSAFLKSNFWRKTFIICKCITYSYFSVDFYHSKSKILEELAISNSTEFTLQRICFLVWYTDLNLGKSRLRWGFFQVLRMILFLLPFTTWAEHTALPSLQNHWYSKNSTIYWRKENKKNAVSLSV